MRGPAAAGPKATGVVFSRTSMLALGVSAAAALSPAVARAQERAPIVLRVDASRAAQGIVRTDETIPVVPGPLTLVYPKWIPGEHGPSGPIANLAGLVVRAGGATIPWRRDPVDLFAYQLDVPAATRALEVGFEYLGADGGRLATPDMLTLEWNRYVLTPRAADSRSVVLAPALRLPAPDWQYATALETTARHGAELSFAPVTLETLVDSPLDAGRYARSFELGSWDGAPVRLAAFADAPRELAASDATVGKFRNLVTQMRALYRNRHFRHYTFLLTLSDALSSEGLEHHESSDNGTRADFLTDETALTASGDLLPHEFNHSWDGKFRRPYDLATPNLQAPMIGDLLWVYEGMTQFYGDLQAERAGLRSREQWLDALALTYAGFDSASGRQTRSLADTAVAASLRGPRIWNSERRGGDYYGESELMWLEADVLIRRLSGGRRSLDDVARSFFGAAASGAPQVVTYTRDDLIAALVAVQPYDWSGFFAARVDAIAPHPPDCFRESGYRLRFDPVRSPYERLQEGRRNTIDLRWSLGLVVRDGAIADVLPDSAAGRAGIGPGSKLVAVNDRAPADRERLDAALLAAEAGAPVRLLLNSGEVYRTVSLDYRGGPRYPRLERVAGTADVLGAIAEPLAAP